MQKKNSVRWAILGAGKIAHKFAQDFPATQGGALVAVAARDTARAQTFADQYGIPLVYTYEALYNSTEVDAVYIATTHNFHYEQGLQCLQHGKAVLCEKPITINDAQFRELVAAAKTADVFLMEAMWMYFLPALHQAKAWLDGGRIGKLVAIQTDFGFAMPFEPEGRLYNPELAGGALLDLGVYTLAFAAYFANTKCTSLVASGVLGTTGVDETTGMLLTYGDLPASLLVSIRTRLRNKALLLGETGYIEIPYFWKAPSVTLYNAEHEVVETVTDDRKTWGYNFEIQEATDAILRGEGESSIMPHAKSNELQGLMTEVRRQIGLKYPMED